MSSRWDTTPEQVARDADSVVAAVRNIYDTMEALYDNQIDYISNSKEFDRRKKFLHDRIIKAEDNVVLATELLQKNIEKVRKEINDEFLEHFDLDLGDPASEMANANNFLSEALGSVIEKLIPPFSTEFADLDTHLEDLLQSKGMYPGEGTSSAVAVGAKAEAFVTRREQVYATEVKYSSGLFRRPPGALFRSLSTVSSAYDMSVSRSILSFKIEVASEMADQYITALTVLLTSRLKLYGSVVHLLAGIASEFAASAQAGLSKYNVSKGSLIAVAHDYSSFRSAEAAMLNFEYRRQALEDKLRLEGDDRALQAAELLTTNVMTGLVAQLRTFASMAGSAANALHAGATTGVSVSL